MPSAIKASETRSGPPAPGAVRAALPKQQAPQLCEAGRTPRGRNWLNEIKFDGYRLMSRVENGVARLTTRNGHDWTDRLPAVARAVSGLDVQSALFDGELVALEPGGLSSFPALQAALSGGHDNTLHYYLFDLLHLNGWDLRPCALRDRKRVLRGLSDWCGMLRWSDHIEGEPGAMQAEARRMKLEGIICKRADAPYSAGRGHGWVKVKFHNREEFAVLGWTPPRGGSSRAGFGALQLGYHDTAGGLHYAGGVGTGFSDQQLAALRERLDAMAADPPAGLAVAGEPLWKGIRWVRPELVAEVRFAAWSGSGRVRHAVFLGLREDKTARDVVRDVADPAAVRVAATPPEATETASGHQRQVVAVPPRRATAAGARTAGGSKIVFAPKPKRR